MINLGKPLDLYSQWHGWRSLNSSVFKATNALWQPMWGFLWTDFHNRLQYLLEDELDD